jgi:hypothetical protein
MLHPVKALVLTTWYVPAGLIVAFLLVTFVESTSRVERRGTRL